MRIAQICRSMNRPAGTERVVIETSQEIERRQIEVRIFTASTRDGLFKTSFSKISRENIRASKSPLFHLYADLLIAKRLIDEASSWADVVILHHGQAMASYAQRKHSLTCIPFFHTNHNLDWSLYGHLRSVAPVYTLPLRMMESNCLENIPVAFANSRDLMIQVREHAKGAKFVVIPLGVDLAKFHPSNEDDEFILMAGRYDPTNNFELAIEALRGTSYRLVIAGVEDSKHGRYAQELRKMVKTSPELRGRVEFVTVQEDELIAFLQRCSIFLSPRKYGYLGLASLEAMACGKPVIAFDPRRGIEECPPVLACDDDRLEWRTTISRLMEDKSHRTALGKKAFQFVKDNHTWPKSVDKMLRVVASLEASKPMFSS